MDQKTIAAYDERASEIAKQYRTVAGGVSDIFPIAFPQPGWRILDLGCGSGRDLDRLLAIGHDAIGWEPSSGLRLEAQLAFPRLQGRIYDLGLPLGRHFLPPEAAGPFAAIVLSAVLMHIPRDLWSEAARDIDGLLASGGRLLISLPTGERTLDPDGRDEGERLYTGMSESDIAAMFPTPGYTALRRWDTEDSLGRPGLGWLTLLLEKGP